MVNRFMTMHLTRYTGGGKHFYWVSYGDVTVPQHRGCPLLRFSPCYIITKDFENKKYPTLNPEWFFNYCTDADESLNRILIISKKIKTNLPNKRWKQIENDKDISWDYELQEELLENYAAEGFPNLVVKCNIKHYERQKFDSLEGLEEKKLNIIENERWDGCYYNLRKDGNYWCSGISMKEDRDSCYEWQQSHPDICKGCNSFFRVK